MYIYIYVYIYIYAHTHTCTHIEQRGKLKNSNCFPGAGRSTGEGIGYPLQYSWASLVAQLVKNLPAMRETWVRSLGWEDSLGEGKGYPLQYPGLENFMGYAMQSMESQRVEHDQVTFTFSDEQLRLGLEMYHLDTIFLTRNLKEVLLINIPSPIWMLS